MPDAPTPEDEAPTAIHTDVAASADEVKAAAEGEADETPEPSRRRRREKLASAAADARERAAGTDVKGLATDTTTLIDTARPFVLGVAAIVFVVLGFFESDSATAQMFVFGGILCIAGAAFSAEITAFVTRRLQSDEADPSGEHADR